MKAKSEFIEDPEAGANFECVMRGLFAAPKPPLSRAHSQNEPKKKRAKKAKNE